MEKWMYKEHLWGWEDISEGQLTQMRDRDGKSQKAFRRWWCLTWLLTEKWRRGWERYSRQGGIALWRHGSLCGEWAGRCGRWGVREEMGNAGSMKSLTCHCMEGERWADESGWRADDTQSDPYFAMICLGNRGQRMERDCRYWKQSASC